MNLIKKDSLKVLIIFITMVIVILMIGYCAGYISSNKVDKETVEIFNTSYKTENFETEIV